MIEIKWDYDNGGLTKQFSHSGLLKYKNHNGFTKMETKVSHQVMEIKVAVLMKIKLTHSMMMMNLIQQCKT